MDSIDKELLREFEKAHSIAQLLAHPGYKYLLEIMQKEMEKDEYNLMNLPPGTDSGLIRDLHLAARISRSKFEQLVLKLNSALDFVTHNDAPNL